MNCKQAFEKGNYFFEIKNYVFARYYYGLSIESHKYREESLYKLIMIEIIDGNFVNARRMLNECLLNSASIVELYAFLEYIEKNFKESRKYYNYLIEEFDKKDFGLISIAKLNISMGDYDIAKSILLSVRENPQYYFKSTLELVYFNLLIHDYNEAMRLLEEIDSLNLSVGVGNHLKIIKYYIKYFLGELKKSEIDLNLKETYMVRRLFEGNEEMLLEHIRRHSDQIIKDTKGCFIEDIDLEKLLSLVRSKIEIINPNHFALTDMYRFKLDFPIGYKRENITNDICVSTITGTNEIITMYPIMLSNDFDKEGYGTNEEIKIKKLRGIKLDV